MDISSLDLWSYTTETPATEASVFVSLYWITNQRGIPMFCQPPRLVYKPPVACV